MEHVTHIIRGVLPDNDDARTYVAINFMPEIERESNTSQNL